MAADDLNDIPFFEGLPDQVRWHLSRAAVRTEYPVGETLFRDGDQRVALWTILEGTLAIDVAALQAANVGDAGSIQLGMRQVRGLLDL